MSEPRSTDAYAVDEVALEAARLRREELGDAAPRIGLFLFGCTDPGLLKDTIARIPSGVRDWLEAVVVVQEPPAAGSWLDARALSDASGRRVLVHRLPRPAGYGGARKAAFEYARLREASHVVTLRGDGRQPPEALPRLLRPVFEDPDLVVLGSRRVGHVASLRAGMGPWRWLVHATTTVVRNRILGLRLGDYQSGMRVYPTAALTRIPHQLNAGDRTFDAHVLIQLRALGVPVVEVPVLPAWREFDSGAEGLGQALRGCAAALDYRLHQLHVTRRGRYFVDEDVHYTLKLSPTGSHMQIVDAIEPDSRVLDLGCSQGLLARPLAEKGVRVTGADVGPGRHLSKHLEAYHTCDLDGPLDLPLGREFDYVVVSDVIEHLRNRKQLLVGARRFLKEGGRLIISTPNIALWFYRLSLLVGRFEYGPRGVLDETHVHLFTRATFRREVGRAGYHVVRERVTALPFEVVFRSTGRSRLVRGVSRVYHGLARLWPELFAYQIILEAEITTLDEESTSP